jgi:hypothetical protein
MAFVLQCGMNWHPAIRNPLGRCLSQPIATLQAPIASHFQAEASQSQPKRAKASQSQGTLGL